MSIHLGCIDIVRLRSELHRTEDSLRAVKREIRTTPPPWPRPLGKELRLLKARATLLCAIVAHARGHLHLRRCTRSHAHLGLPPLEEVTFEQQERFIGDRWREFARPELIAAVGGGGAVMLR